ncbi:MAG: ABC transporter ATP-binding protein [Oligoflexia bacterium]|nr:ABC transporter ATP-binding protein [Oligoflexia bacterium]
MTQKQKKLFQTLPQLILNQFFDYWAYYIFALISLFGTHWIQSYLPFLAKDLSEKAAIPGFTFPTYQFFLLALGIIVFRSSSRILFFYPARILQKDLRVELLSLIENASPFRYKKYSDGQLFQIMSGDMEEIRALIGFALLQVGNIIIAMFVLIPKIMSFDKGLIIGLTPLIVSFTLFTIIVTYNRKYYRKVMDLQGDVQNCIIETYAGKKTIKNFHSEKQFISLFQNYSLKELLNFYKASVRIGVAFPLTPLGVGLSLIWGGFYIYENQLGASSLILFSGFIFLFLEPLMFLSWIGVVIARSIGSWKRIQELVTDIRKTSNEETNLEEGNKKHSGRNFCVEFWDQEIDFCFPEQLWTVFIGKTGEGKTHVINQLAEALRQRDYNISYVAQAPYLYNDSVLANIFLGKEPSEKEINKAKQYLDIFGLDYLDKDLDSVLKMEVGENGKHLSGGQAKRLCLIRSILSDSEVILWDDPFSSVDLILEKKIIQSLKEDNEFNKKTVILSSHRLSTVRMCDQIYFLSKDEGISENGLTEKLLMDGTKTYEYFQNQMV